MNCFKVDVNNIIRASLALPSYVLPLNFNFPSVLRLIFQLSPLVVNELAKANTSDAKPMSRPNVTDWLW